MNAPSRLEGVFRRVVALRLPILVLYALLLPVAAVLAMRIPSEGAIDKLIVASDPDFAATRAFQKIFPEGQLVMLLFEADDPWRPEVLAEVEATEQALRAIPGVTPYGLLDVYRRARPGFAPSPAGDEELKRFASGTDFFRRQGLVGDRFQGMAVAFVAKGAKERVATLAAIDRAVAGARRGAARGALLGEAGRRFAAAGIRTLRTMVSRDDVPVLSFFRASGFRGGAFVQLEVELPEEVPG